MGHAVDALGCIWQHLSCVSPDTVPIHHDCELLCGSKPETFDDPPSAHRKPLWHQRHGCIGSWEVTERMEQTICVWLLTYWLCEPQQGTFPLCAEISTSNFRYTPKRIEMGSLEHVCTHTFIAAVFIRTMVWPEPQVFSLEEWVSKWWSTQWNIVHPWKRRKFWPMLHGTRMNLEYIIWPVKSVQLQRIVCGQWRGGSKSKSQWSEQNGGSQGWEEGTCTLLFNNKNTGPKKWLVVTPMRHHDLRLQACVPTWHHRAMHLQSLTLWVLLLIFRA